jgi:hypothetical protein
LGEAAEKYGMVPLSFVLSLHKNQIIKIKWTGALVRVGPNELATSNPDDIRQINGVRSRYTRSKSFKLLQLIPGHDNIVTQRDDDLHTALRYKMANGVSLLHLQSGQRYMLTFFSTRAKKTIISSSLSIRTLPSW